MFEFVPQCAIVTIPLALELVQASSMQQIPFTPEMATFYHEQGYLHVPGLFSPDEAAGYRTELHALAGRMGAKDGTWASVKDEGTALTHVHDVHCWSASITRLLTDPRLMTIAKGIIGPNVQLHHNKMFIKPPENGSPFPMHQDYLYFPHRHHSMIAAILHFDDAPEEKGCLRVYPGSHRLGPLRADGTDNHQPADLYPAAGATPIEAKAGDAIFFSYLLIHGSGLNVSNEPRTTLLIQMRDPADEQLNDRHASRGQGMMLAGIDPRQESFRFAWAESAS